MRLACNWLVPVALFATLACSHELDGPTPAITSFEPPLVCNIVRTEVTLTGSGLSPLAIDALTDNPKLKLPQITLQRIQDQNGNPVSDAPVIIPDDPANPAASDVRWVSQTEMQFFVDPSLMLPPGTYTVTVTNGNGKTFTATVDLTVVEPPVLTGIVPQSSCPQGGAVDISGTGFAPTATASIGGQMLTTDNVTPTDLMATLGPGLSPGTYDVVVDNGGGCTDTLPDAFVVTPGVAVFFVDPNVDYNAINTQANIFVSGLIKQPVSVTIAPTGGGASQALTPFVWSASKPNRIQAIIPIGLAPGQWDLTVDDGNCAATLSPAFTVTDTLTVSIASIDPLFGRPDEDTAVTIRATDPAPAGFVQFMQTPRAFLNPDSGGATAIANQLVAVDFISATQLTAIVPKGLPPGLYDLIVINPDGTVGLLDKAFTITPPAAPPPIIDDITPGSVANKTAQAVEITGAFFRTPTVVATCQTDAGAMLTVNGTGVTVNAGGTILDVTFDMSPLSPAVCVLRVTDDDGTFADFSALGVNLPSGNVPQTVADQSMNTPRRALAASAGRVTSLARFLYAIGGDDGSDAGLIGSVEAAPIDPFGHLSSAFVDLPAGLPEARSFATAVTIGRFIYLPGGRTAAGATASVLRAQVLDPRAVPEISDVAFEPVPAGLTPGLYYYRVSAVMSATDPSNPGGETLPSDPISIVVPTIVGGAQVKLTLFWTALPNADHYRVYRSPTPNGSLEDIVLVGDDLAMPQFPDAGAAAVSPAEVPLAPGSLGTWHEVGPLSTAREGAGVAFAADPDTPGGFFLYAVGGRDASGAVLDDYDFAAISQAADGSQTVGAFSSGGSYLATARWQLGAVAADHAHAPNVAAGQTFIYALDGLGAAAVVSDVTAGLVNGDGTLTANEVQGVSHSSSGYAYAVASNILYNFGGGAPGALPTNTAQSGTICVPGSNCEPPEIINWNNFGFSLTQPRWLPGSALESAFIFIVGGASTGPNTASNTIERTHW